MATRLRPGLAIYLAAAVGLFLLSAASVNAAQVNGRLAAYEGNSAQGGRYLHLENEVTGDSYLMQTGSDGTFQTRLPPGVYDLRAEHGAILVHAIVVGPDATIALGQVSELAPYAPPRLWQYQTIASSLLASAAPSTANILTSVVRQLPPGRRVMEAPLPTFTTATSELPRPAIAAGPPLLSETPNLQPQSARQAPSGTAAQSPMPTAPMQTGPPQMGTMGGPPSQAGGLPSQGAPATSPY